MTAQSDRAIRSIAVVGDDAVGLSAALAFALHLPQAEVSVIAIGREPALADFALASMPEVRRFHAAVRIDEDELLRSGAAVHHLGTRFAAPGAEPWVHAYGDYGVPDWPVLFHHMWARARSAGEGEPYHRYSPAAVLTEAGKFVHPQPDWPLSSYRYAFRFDPDAYRVFLEDRARKAGVALVAGPWGDAERREDGGVAAIRLGDGRAITADLFVDCSGGRALLAGALPGAFESWADHFPFDRLERSAAPGEVSPSDSVDLGESGWRWSQPLANRSFVTTATSSCAAGDESTGALSATFRYGRRPEPWIANTVAIGEAAVAVDPLHGANLHLAHSAILRALELLPGRDCNPVEIGEYNRRSAQEAVRVRDFLALHHLRPGGDMAGAPDSLLHTLDQFDHRGRLPFYAEESFTRDSWVAAMIGLGFVPRHSDLVAGRMDSAQSAQAMARLAAALAGLPAQLPSYPDYLAGIKAAPAR